MQARRGLIVTFYSYKGGVGRSMALANVAILLAQAGRRVLVVDWDLEAPGLDRYFDCEDADPRQSERFDAGRRAAPGLVDLVRAYQEGQPIDWRTCLLDTRPKEGLWLLGAGRRDESYFHHAQSLDWQRLFEAHDFGEYLERLREEWVRDFDYVLIDSRTGTTDVGGICCIQMPDVLITFFTTNRQSLEGVKVVMQRVQQARQRLPFDRERLALVPVLARDESATEYEAALRWREICARELGAFCREWLPQDVSPRDLLEQLKIPYRPYWSFGERLPVIAENSADPLSISRAYALLARLIDNRLDWKAAVG